MSVWIEGKTVQVRRPSNNFSKITHGLSGCSPRVLVGGFTSPSTLHTLRIKRSGSLII